MTRFLGPALVLMFCVSQAFRDVYCGHVFQGVDFFAVITIAFLLSTVIFVVAALARTPGDVRKLRGHGTTVLAMNLTTALAWSCYFFGLTHIEPSIVNTLHSGMAPLTVLALAAVGVGMAKTAPVGRWEQAGYAGMALSLASLWWVVLSANSGIAGGRTPFIVAGLALPLVSGASITVSLLYCKRLQDHGVSPEVVTSVRYIALIALAGAVILANGGTTGIDTLPELATLSVLSTILIVLPLFALQVGIAFTAPLTANVLRSLGPVFVFGLEQFDGRIVYSTPTFVCILAYSAAAILANVAHGWRAQAATPKLHTPLSAS